MSSSADRAKSGETSRSLLKKGLASLKRKQYDTAIAQLQKVCQISKSPKNICQAQMGLVNAYANCRRPREAISLSRQLCQTPNPKVQQWAQQTLEVLLKRFPDADEPESLGFEPFDNSENPESTPRELGFEPFDNPNNPNSTPGELGFEPLETASSSPTFPVAASREIAYVPEEISPPPPPPGSPKTRPSRDASPDTSTTPSRQTPQTESPETPPTPNEPPTTWQERNAPRAVNWKPLKSTNLAQLRWLEFATVLATFLLLCLLLHGLKTYNERNSRSLYVFNLASDTSVLRKPYWKNCRVFGGAVCGVSLAVRRVVAVWVRVQTVFSEQAQEIQSRSGAVGASVL